MLFTQTIPVLDLRDFYADDRRQAFVRQLGSALEDIGFFAITHHGVEATLIQAAYQAAQAFFTLPEDVKRRYDDPALHGQRGFTVFGREHAKDHPVSDLKEFWHVGRDLPPDHPLTASYPANISPVEVPAFAAVMNQLYAQLDACAKDLLKACALYLGAPENLLSDMTRDSDTILRVLHYPPIAPDVHPASLRAAPHEDINLITLLCEATDDGLELLQRDGTWRSIRALPGQIIVDSGDMLQQLTNGLLKSTTHRVVNPTDSRARRFSMPFFAHPRAEVDLTPLQSCFAKTGGQRFPSITAGAYLQQRLREIGLVV
ncbi:isopenicillin N synthase family dioxygenase [Stenomitos frigidus]|uniref:Isopenicillin N synthase family oxygenase n=1 Tax=Stenomitos frigidus ULC18 TaxID=2107698 RepID=A0A2T1EAS4_9CYAN|nr:2-oxoglutarate and iron-dependent oxygenase domain-containing protein [Stenomitos frigidus]PSB29801.1 isopenicillin N synthase family oxygenase [Stenomitos frigidus ULC18]